MSWRPPRIIEGTLDRLPAGTGNNPPFESLVHRHEVKALAGIDSDDEDQLIDRLCVVATEAIAEHTQLSLARRQWRTEALEWPFATTMRTAADGSSLCILSLPGPVLDDPAVVAAEWRQTRSDSWTALDAGDWSVHLRRGSRTAPATFHVDLRAGGGYGYRVTFWRGWSARSGVPATLRHAARALVGELLSSPELSSDMRRFDAASMMPFSIVSMVRGYRIQHRADGRVAA